MVEPQRVGEGGDDTFGEEGGLLQGLRLGTDWGGGVHGRFGGWGGVGWSNVKGVAEYEAVGFDTWLCP